MQKSMNRPLEPFTVPNLLLIIFYCFPELFLSCFPFLLIITFFNLCQHQTCNRNAPSVSRTCLVTSLGVAMIFLAPNPRFQQRCPKRLERFGPRIRIAFLVDLIPAVLNAFFGRVPRHGVADSTGQVEDDVAGSFGVVQRRNNRL